MEDKTLLHIKADVLKQSKEEDGVIEAIIGSSSVVDRMGDVIDQTGWDLKNYKKNPVILWGHNMYEERPPIGKATKVWLEGEGKSAKLMFKVLFDLKDEFASEIYRKVREGFVNTVSVGFRPKEWERIENKDGDSPRMGIKFLKQELLELSFVPVPANQEALVSLRSIGIEGKSMEELFPKVQDVDLGIEVKREHVLEYKALGTEPATDTFDPHGESTKAKNFDDLKDLGAWTDATEVKFIHHNGDNKRTVLRGVQLAMAELMGARGVIELPEMEVRGVYDHLSKHYNEFGLEAPDYAHVENQTLNKLFNEVHAFVLDREDKHVVRLLQGLYKKINVKKDTEDSQVILALKSVNDAVSKLNFKGGE